MGSGVPSLWLCADTHFGGGTLTPRLLSLFLTGGKVIYFSAPFYPCKRCSLAASARQGSPRPRGVPSAQPDLGGLQQGTPGDPGVRRRMPRRWVRGVTSRNCLTNGLSPLFPGSLLCNWNESYQQNRTKPIHWVLNEYLRCL